MTQYPSNAVRVHSPVIYPEITVPCLPNGANP